MSVLFPLDGVEQRLGFGELAGFSQDVAQASRDHLRFEPPALIEQARGEIRRAGQQRHTRVERGEQSLRLLEMSGVYSFFDRAEAGIVEGAVPHGGASYTGSMFCYFQSDGVDYSSRR